MPWWLWIPVGLVSLLVLLAIAARAWRKRIALEFAEHLRKRHPEFEVLEITPNRLKVGKDGHDGQIELYKVMSACSRQKTDDAEARRRIYDEFLDAILSAAAPEKLSLAEHGERILPQLVPPSALRDLAKVGEVPHRPAGALPLSVVYVLDSEKSVQYLTSDFLADLQLSPEALYELAIGNLGKRFPESLVRSLFEKRTVVMAKAMDSYDAARILLVPGYLKDSEMVAAVIPDRDTLSLMAISTREEADSMDTLAKTLCNPDKPLLNRPVVITRAGFEVR